MKPLDRLSEEAIYELVADELKRGQRREGLWVKAYSQAGGDETKAKAMYIELRKQSILDEMAVNQDMEEAVTKEKRKKDKARAKARVKAEKVEVDLAKPASKDPIVWFFKDPIVWFFIVAWFLALLYLSLCN